jgi:hypothetical protein
MPDIPTVKVRVGPVVEKTEAKTEVKTEVASQYVAATVEPARVAAVVAPPAPTPPPVVVEAPAPVQRAVEAPPQPNIDELLAQADSRISRGDIEAARKLLSDSEPLGSGAVTFKLAQTYDPTMLAAWNLRGVTADTNRARFLYTKALGMGVGAAQKRLDMLRP